MAQEFILNGDAQAPSVSFPGTQGIFKASRGASFNVCKPTKMIVLCTAATYDLSKILYPSAYSGLEQQAANLSPAFHGARSAGLTLEGPFIEYEVARGGDSNREKIANYAQLNGIHDPEARRFVFDSVQGRPICHPWAGTVTFFTQYPGQWKFQVVLVEWEHNQVSPIESEVTLSLPVISAVDGNKFRVAGVPVGAHSYTYRDSQTSATVFPSITMMTDDTSKSGTITPAGGAYTNIRTADAFAMSSQFYGRAGLGNARRIRVDGIQLADTVTTGMLQFHISLL